MQFSEEKREILKARTKLGRFATIEDVAEQVLFLVNSKSITGQNIIIDSGFSL